MSGIPSRGPCGIILGTHQLDHLDMEHISNEINIYAFVVFFKSCVEQKTTYKEKFAKRPSSLLGVYPMVCFYSVLLQV